MNKESVVIEFSKEETDLLNEVCPIVGKLCELEQKLKDFMERGPDARSEHFKAIEKMVLGYYTCIKIIQAQSEGHDVEVEIVRKEREPLFIVDGKTFY